MPNDIVQVFDNDQFGQIRVVTTDGEPWFVAKDVCDALGIDTNHIREALDDDEVNTLRITEGKGNPNKTIITEAGLYSLILRSRKPEAKAFKRWVTHEVLPSIRKSGGYMIAKPEETPEEIMARALLIANETIERQKSKLEEMKPKALFADAVSASKTSILVGDLAKLLRQNGFEVGQNRLFGILRDQGFLCKQRGAMWNMPTQRSMEMGLFEVKETAVTNSDGHVTVHKTSKITGKGQIYFVNRFCPR